jgi:hypothetical protein
MSKRTLDAFLLSPATANTKKAKALPSRNAGRSQPKLSARNDTKDTKPRPSVVEVVDLDEIIDVDSPSPPPPNFGKAEDPRKDPLVVDVDSKSEDNAGAGIKQADRSRTTINATSAPTDLPALASPPHTHANYPFPIPQLPFILADAISAAPIKLPKLLNHLPHLDLLTYEPYLGAKESREYGEFLRRELPFYRVEYKLTRFGKPTDIRTPRFTVGSRDAPWLFRETDHRVMYRRCLAWTRPLVSRRMEVL